MSRSRSIGPNGFLIARDLGVTDVSPIEDPVHFVAGTQVQDVIDALDEEGGSSIFVRDLSFPPPLPGVSEYLAAAGFEPVAHDEASRDDPVAAPGTLSAMRVARNIAIILLLALIVDVVPGGGNAARAIMTAITLIFCALIGFAGYQLYRANRLTYVGLTDRQRAILLGSLGAIVLMIAGLDELTSTGVGLLVWLAVIALSIFSLVKIWTDVRSSY